MDLFGHMRIHESGTDHSPETPTTSNTPTMPSPTLSPSPCAPITITITTSATDTDTADFPCQHCPRTFTSRTGLVGHLRIHRTGTAETVPEAPIYTHRKRLHSPHCPRTSTHRMGLFSTCASTVTCGRQPPAASHPHTLPPSFPPSPSSNQISTLTHRKHPNDTSHTSGKCSSQLGPHAASAARAT
ncbi:hypothetical protein SprV_0200776300 [Sparganum proliferum]